MVCISCIVIPVVLWLWHRFLQPIVLKFWNPWGKVEDQSEKESSTLKCPISNGTSKNEQKEEIVSGNTKGKVD